jgi:FkbM family methyltransferase
LSNIRLNRLTSKIIPVNYALSDHEGPSKLYLSQQAGATHTLHKRHLENAGFVPKVINIKAITLDRLLSNLGINRVDLLKIDVEGAEIDVLKGGVHALNNKHIDKLIIEVHKKINNPINVKKVLEDMGYTILSHVYIDEIKDIIYANVH